MGDAEGSGSQEPGPSASHERLESLRRGLYARGGSPDLLREYLGAEADLRVDEPPRDGAVEGTSDDGRDEDVRRTPRARRVTTAIVLGCAAAVVLGGLLWWTLGSGPALPDRLGPPAAAGRTLLYYSRAANAESAPDKVTFEPADERVLFHADGQRLTVVLRCVGRGAVRITADEQRFDFRCDDRLQTLTRRSGHVVHGPFLILGRTVGDVVWGMRVTSTPAPA